MREQYDYPDFVSKKESITIRLDAVIVQWYRATGPRWQSRVNHDLAQLVARRQTTKTAKRGKR